MLCPQQAIHNTGKLFCQVFSLASIVSSRSQFEVRQSLAQREEDWVASGIIAVGGRPQLPFDGNPLFSRCQPAFVCFSDWDRIYDAIDRDYRGLHLIGLLGLASWRVRIFARELTTAKRELIKVMHNFFLPLKLDNKTRWISKLLKIKALKFNFRNTGDQFWFSAILSLWTKFSEPYWTRHITILCPVQSQHLWINTMESHPNFVPPSTW